ncbi:MAG: hypothetical protein FWB74_07735 [Defluviitaleaceae bacterium]|nr:hypothetical protein [Defluviitaleaceae bacterium]
MVYRHLYCLFGYRDALAKEKLYRVVVTMRLHALEGDMWAHAGDHTDVLEFSVSQ